MYFSDINLAKSHIIDYTITIGIMFLGGFYMNIKLGSYGYTICSPDWAVDFTTRAHHTVYYCVSGEAYYYYNNNKYSIEKNTFYFFPMFCNCKIEHNPKSPFKVMWFHLNLIPKMNSEIYKLSTENNTYYSLLTELLMYSVSQSRKSFIQAVNLFIYMCTEDKIISISKNEKITAVLQFIEDNVTEVITNDTLCELISYNKQYFIKFFKNQTGVTPHSYIKNLRLNKAFDYLKQGFSVQETSEKYGFSDANVLSRDIKARYGINASKIKLFNDDCFI